MHAGLAKLDLLCLILPSSVGIRLTVGDAARELWGNQEGLRLFLD